MGRSRWTVGGLMDVVLAVAVGFAALKAATGIWELVIESLALAVLVGTVCGAWLREGRERASWAGAAVAGWGYASICLFVSAAGFEDPSPITRRIDWIHHHIYDQ